METEPHVRPKRRSIGLKLSLTLVASMALFGTVTLLVLSQRIGVSFQLVHATYAVDLARMAPGVFDYRSVESVGFSEAARRADLTMARTRPAVWREMTAIDPSLVEFSLLVRRAGKWEVFLSSDPRLVGTEPGARDVAPFLPADGVWTNFPLDESIAGLGYDPVTQVSVAGRFSPGFKLRALDAGWDFTDARLSCKYRGTRVNWLPVDAFLYMAIWAAAVLVLLLPVAVYFAVRIARRVRIVRGTLAELAQGNFDARADVDGWDELGQLADHVNNMAAGLAERERLKIEIQVAATMQRELLPAEPPAVAGLDIASANVMCDRVGGDYFDFLLHGPHLWVLAGDVSGHGIVSALFMASARANARLLIERGVTPMELMQALNERLLQDSHSGHFLTLAALRLRLEDFRYVHVSAGHEPTLVMRGGAITRLETTTTPLGLFPELPSRRPPDEGRLHPGDWLLLSTDGLRECHNDAGEQFGMPRVAAILGDGAQSAADVARNLMRAAQEHRGGRPWEDDVTVVAIRRESSAAIEAGGRRPPAHFHASPTGRF